MTRYTITTPTRDNDGRERPETPITVRESGLMSTYEEFARERVLSAFDGATAVPGSGYWRDPSTGETYSDPVTVWTIDTPEDRAADVVGVAGSIARYARQRAVYVTATDARGFRSVLVGPSASDTFLSARELRGESLISSASIAA